MNNIKKMMSHFLVLGLIAGSGFSVAFFNGRTSTPVRAEEETETQTKQYSEEDFKNEVEVDSNLLGVSISQSNVTETSQSLTFSFRSKTSKGFKNAKDTFVVQITDESYPGEISSLTEEYYTCDYEGAKEELEDGTYLPVFDGSIAFVTSSDKKDVYLPSKMTYAGKLVINITGISKNAITKDGEGLKGGENVWGSIKEVHIPETIKFADEGSFTGNSNAKIYYEGDELPEGFEAGWTDVNDGNVICDPTSYPEKKSGERSIGVSTDIDIQDKYNRPVSFILGCKQTKDHEGEEYDRPLVMEYTVITKKEDGSESREKKFETLPLINTTNTYYDSCGKISKMSYSRLLTYRFEPNQTIDDEEIYFHNIMKAPDDSNPDTSVVYKAKAKIAYFDKQNINKLVTYKASLVSTFIGYSLFSMTMDKAFVTTEEDPTPHSLYKDVKREMYEQNKKNIENGSTKIRYSLYNLYNSAYFFEYEGKGGQIKEAVIPIKSVVSYQILEKNKGNKVSILIKNSSVAPDFSAEKVRLCELKDVTIQMDLMAKTASGSQSLIGKSAVSYKFAYVAVTPKKSFVFNWNLFIILFYTAYAAVYFAASFITYRVRKEKYKNDEFRRVNGKRFAKQAVIGGLGLAVILGALLFIFMRVVGFSNSIMVFNPTDPLLIGFSIVGLIIFGYFVVYFIKLIKAEQERRKAIRLKLNEDVEDDGTN